MNSDWRPCFILMTFWMAFACFLFPLIWRLKSEVDAVNRSKLELDCMQFFRSKIWQIMLHNIAAFNFSFLFVMNFFSSPAGQACNKWIYGKDVRTCFANYFIKFVLIFVFVICHRQKFASVKFIWMPDEKFSISVLENSIETDKNWKWRGRELIAVIIFTITSHFMPPHLFST